MKYKVLNMDWDGRTEFKVPEVPNTYSIAMPMNLYFINGRVVDNDDNLKAQIKSIFTNNFVSNSFYELVKDLKSEGGLKYDTIMIYIISLDEFTKNYPLTKPIISNMYKDLTELHISKALEHKETGVYDILKEIDNIINNFHKELKECLEIYSKNKKRRKLVIAYLDFIKRIYGIKYTEAEIEFYMNKKDPVSITIVDFHTNEELGSENILSMQYMVDIDKLSILCYVNEELTGEIKIHSAEELIHIFKTKSLDFFTNHPVFGRLTMDSFKGYPIETPNDYIIVKEILETVLGKDDGYYKAVFNDTTIQFLFINDGIYLDTKEEILDISDIDKKPTYIPDNSIVTDINGNIVSLKSKFKNMEITPISRKEYISVKHSNTLIGFYL